MLTALIEMTRGGPTISVQGEESLSGELRGDHRRWLYSKHSKFPFLKKQSMLPPAVTGGCKWGREKRGNEQKEETAN